MVASTLSCLITEFRNKPRADVLTFINTHRSLGESAGKVGAQVKRKYQGRIFNLLILLKKKCVG